ncbi:MAG: TlpA family protein disulfide reductase [Mucilaginibacter sp.]
MKRVLLLCMVLLGHIAWGQTATITETGTITRTTAAGITTKSFSRTHVMDSTTLVKDSMGRRYAYKEWHDKVLSGGYMLRKNSAPDDSSDNYMLVKLSDADLARIKAMRSKMNPDESGVIRTGAKFNFVRAKAIDGYEVLPDKLAGKVVIINFWFIGCAPCRAEMPELNKIATAYTNNPDVVFIGVSTDEKDKIEEFLKTSPFQYHHIPDGRKLAAMYQVKGYPTNVIVGKDGNIKKHSMGYGPGMLDDFSKVIAEELAK